MTFRFLESDEHVRVKEDTVRLMPAASHGKEQASHRTTVEEKDYCIRS